MLASYSDPVFSFLARAESTKYIKPFSAQGVSL